MSIDRLSGAPSFITGAVTWNCWVTDDGQRFEWRSTCGRYKAGSSLVPGQPSAFPPGKCPNFVAVWWCRAGDRLIGKSYKNLGDAMHAAIAARASA